MHTSTVTNLFEDRFDTYRTYSILSLNCNRYKGFFLVLGSSSVWAYTSSNCGVFSPWSKQLFIRYKNVKNLFRHECLMISCRWSVSVCVFMDRWQQYLCHSWCIKSQMCHTYIMGMGITVAHNCLEFSFKDAGNISMDTPNTTRGFTNTALLTLLHSEAP